MRLDDIMEAIVSELFWQSMTFSNAADAPTVSQNENERFVHIDGAINVEALARAVIARS
jgi:hypothetical protein